MKYFLFFIVFNCFIGFSQESSFYNIARRGTVEEAKVLVAQNPEIINTPNEYGFSPLILACYNGNIKMVYFLIEQKAVINYISQEGTALMGATVKGNEQLVALLLENGADTNLTNQDGITALMYAVQFKNPKIIKLLLQHNANKTLVDNEGRTAFEYAVFTKQDEIINLLK